MNKYILISALFLLLGATSCEDFLEPTLNDRYSELDAWSSEYNANMYLTGFYNGLNLYSGYGSAGSIWLGGGALTDGLSDILKFGASVPSPGGHANMMAFYEGNVSPAGFGLNVWGDAYTRIRRVNEFLHSLHEFADFSEDSQIKMEAQIRYIRAYLYFVLVRNHGSVVIREDLDGPDEKSLDRSPESICWDYIASELDYAAENLPVKWPAADLGRATKGAAYALKSRAMLFAKRWEAAEKAAQMVRDLKYEGAPVYGLADNYADALTDDNNEVIMAVRYGGDFTHSFDLNFAPKGDFVQDGLGGWACPTQELVDSYLMADGTVFNWDNPDHAANPYTNREPRFYASILYNGATWKGRTIETYVGGKDAFFEYGSKDYPEGNTVTGYYMRKLLDETIAKPEDASGTKDWVEIRYAEVLLNQAEALNESGQSAKALEPLNKIRRRVNLPEVTETDQARLRNIIREERKVELAFENHRYWDLRRWRIATEVLNGNEARVHGMKIIKFGSKFIYQKVDVDKTDRYFPAKYYQFPIPQSEIANNPAISQIEGW